MYYCLNINDYYLGYYFYSSTFLNPFNSTFFLNIIYDQAKINPFFITLNRLDRTICPIVFMFGYYFESGPANYKNEM